MNDLAAVVKAAADEGKCYDNAMKEVKLPKYESWGNTPRGSPATSSATACCTVAAFDRFARCV